METCQQTANGAFSYSGCVTNLAFPIGLIGQALTEQALGVVGPWWDRPLVREALGEITAGGVFGAVGSG